MVGKKRLWQRLDSIAKFNLFCGLALIIFGWVGTFILYPHDATVGLPSIWLTILGFGNIILVLWGIKN